MMVHLVISGAVLFSGGTLISFLKKSIELASLQGVDVFEGMLIYSTATAGSFMVLKLLAVILFLTGFLFVWSVTRLQKNMILFALALPLIGILFMQSQVSHASASHILPELSVLVTFIHLTTKELIVGGVILLAIALYLYDREKKSAHSLTLLKYFNLLAGVCLVGAAVSGAYVTWLHLKGIENVFLTQWGERFIYLIVATLALGVLRVFHQCILTPYFARNARLRTCALVTIPVEAVLGVLVLFFSGYISLTTPPYTVEAYTFLEESISEGARIVLEVHPYEHDMMRITITDADSNTPLKIDGITVTAQQTERNIGPNVLPLSQRAVGTYVFPQVDLVPAGVWDIAVIVDQKEGYDAYGNFSIKYPEDIETSLSSDEHRSFDTFALWSIIVGVGMSVFGGVLIYLAYRSIRYELVEIIPGSSVASVTHVSLAVIVSLSIALLVIAFGHVLTTTPLKQECLRDGHVWQQTYPTRDFERTSPNTLAGCTVHQGHYHFIDINEYHFFKGGDK